MKKILCICLVIVLLVSTGLTAYATEEEPAIGQETADLPRDEDESAASSIMVNRDVLTVENEEAEAVFKEFLDAVGFIANDPSWNGSIGTFLYYYDIYAKSENGEGDMYEKCVSGGTKEDYLAMHLFDRFVWMETYVYLANAIIEGNRSYYLDNKETFKTRLTDLTIGRMNGNNADVVKEAYLTLMDWQYDYIMTTGVPFNFINNRSYLDEIKETQSMTPIDSTKSGLESEEKSAQSSQDPATADPAEEKGIWEDTLTVLSRNLISIAIIIVFGGILVVLYVIRRRNNIDIN